MTFVHGHSNPYDRLTKAAFFIFLIILHSVRINPVTGQVHLTGL